jgi:hypothetical protein
LEKEEKKVAQSLDWKQWRRGWPYKGVYDPKYLKDKSALFKINGNGWWFLEPYSYPYSDSGK